MRTLRVLAKSVRPSSCFSQDHPSFNTDSPRPVGNLFPRPNNAVSFNALPARMFFLKRKPQDFLALSSAFLSSLWSLSRTRKACEAVSPFQCILKKKMGLLDSNLWLLPATILFISIRVAPMICASSTDY